MNAGIVQATEGEAFGWRNKMVPIQGTAQSALGLCLRAAQASMTDNEREAPLVPLVEESILQH
ncbi:hypothetical protein KSZ_05730 [Dictyobacter formicarum]|uniref:Uncharacterized protein n=1 Tax=Dictyobacter formicarum TaxID=2778368 RepID=A0ABQ3V9K9_9CHLR|nr:hypothetical protein KSZ_05730 [Dictyobacter formicarum]